MLRITIDGPAGAGKSTVAQLLAARLGLRYLDTGATFRMLAYEALARGVDPHDAAAVARLARTVRVELRPSRHHPRWRGRAPARSAFRGCPDGSRFRSAASRGAGGRVALRPRRGALRVLLNDRDVTRQIRSERVTETAAVIAQFPGVRARLVTLQRDLAGVRATVAEGRDTGTVVFPDAPYKFFLTATVPVRAARRRQELRRLNGCSASQATIARQLRARDALDVHRTVGPLVKPAGAVLIDTSRLTARQVVDRLLRHLRSS